MDTSLLQRALNFISGIGATPDDTEDLRLQKTLLLIGTLLFIVAGALWAATTTLRLFTSVVTMRLTLPFIIFFLRFFFGTVAPARWPVPAGSG